MVRFETSTRLAGKLLKYSLELFFKTLTQLQTFFFQKSYKFRRIATPNITR